MCDRISAKVVRKPITVLSENGCHYGNWYPFNKPEGSEPPFLGRLTASQRVLWCPWCDSWNIFDKKLATNSDSYRCTGPCGWANTDEYYVKTYNGLWFENIPLDELRKMHIPGPSKGR